MTIYMMVGIPGSGKTTAAKELCIKHNCQIVSTDVIRQMNPDVEEEKIWPLVYEMCAKLVDEDLDFIYDATNITPKVRERFVSKLHELTTKPFQIGVYYLKTDWRICTERVIQRNKDEKERFLPPEVIESYGQKIIEPKKEEGFIFVEKIEK